MPKLLTTPFASEATSEYRTDIQNTTGAEPNSATYEQGFPPVTMEKIANGGKPPKGSDLNGVLYDITDNLVALTKGARYGFNEAYATAIGGYPLGAVLRLDNGIEVESEVDSNSINPNVDMTGWKLAVSDNGVITWSGRTQREENIYSYEGINDLDNRSQQLELSNSNIEKKLGFKNTVSIKHFIQDNQIYDVAVLSVSPDKFNLVGNHVDNQPLGYMSTTTAKEASYQFNSPIACNASAFSTIEGSDFLRPYGIYIEDRKIYSDWNTSADNRNEACCMMSDGILKRYFRSDADAQKMLDDGAVWGLGFGAWCVYNGTIPIGVNSTGAGSVTSGRTIIGQREDGTYLIIMVEGVTGSYGANGQQCGEIALRHGAVRAFICDGGGSSQLWWNGCYAMPSSDYPTYRKVASFFTVDVPSAPTYLSGKIEVEASDHLTGSIINTLPKIYLSQVGQQVNLTANASGFTTATAINKTAIPKRYRPITAIEVRAIQAPVGGGTYTLSMLDTASMPSTGIINSNLVSGTCVNTTGSCHWLQKTD